MKNKTKKTLKGVLAGTLAVGTLIGGVATINHFVNRADEDGLVKVNLKYDIGGLNSQGEYEETDESIYTKNAFEAQGLNIEVAFDSNITYEVFFYDEYGEFISKTGVLEKNYKDDIPVTSTHARIEITPKDDEDGVKWYEKTGYAKQIEVKVNEKQLSFLELIEKNENVYTLMGQGLYNMSEGSFSSSTSSPWFFSGVIDCSNASEIIIKLPTTELSRKVTYSGNERFAINMYNLTDSIDMGYDVSTINIICNDKEYSFISVDCEDFDSFIFSTSVNVVDDIAVYLL